MKKKKDIETLIKSAKEDLEVLNSFTLEFINKHEEKVNVLVNRIILDLRKTLDYLIQDISENLLANEKSRSLYFPLAVDKPEFDSLCERYFSKTELRREVFKVIEKYQNYNDGKTLLTLNELSREGRHHNLIRIQKNMNFLPTLGGIEIFSDSNEEKRPGTYIKYINGPSLRQLKTLDGLQEEIDNNYPGVGLKIVHTLLFINKNVEILPFLLNCSEEVQALTEDIYGHWS